ncbi:MAG: signal peptidase I [Chloroflexi bacterium]|nr:signal peptidase I [Chloroflexota bacterium]
MLYRPGPLFTPETASLLVAAGEWVKTILVGVVLVVVINLFFPRYVVDGRSMEPQLHSWDLLFATSLDVMTNQLQRGDVVALISPRDGVRVVKRIIGLPGERVEVQDGQVYINGEALPENYINEPPRYTGMWQVGEDQYFVLGDNRNHSLDSHVYGPVDRDRIQGVVKFRYWPLNQISLMPVPEY